MLTKKIKFYLPFKIAFIYFIVSSVYIIFSDKFLENFSSGTLSKLQSYKGLGFVLITSILLFILIKKNLNKIKVSEQKYRLLADNSRDLIYLLNPDSKIVYSSPSAKELLGFNNEDILGKNLYDFIHPNDLKKVEKGFNDLILKGTSKKPIVYRVKNKSNKYIWFESLKQLITKDNKVIGMVSACRDITERVEANKAIKNYQKSLQNLTSEILLVEEKQRKEIAANIHDHLSQSLVISKMRLQDLREHECLKDYTSDIDFISSHITDALENSRKITYDLCPPVLYQLGIIDTMHWFSDKIEDTYNIKVKFTTNIESLKLDDNKLISIFRSIQEIVTNSIKHANASLIHIDFKLEDKGLNISVCDDGIGFDTNKKLGNKILNSGFGLFTLKERIHNLKGTVNIISKPDIEIGTIIEIFVYL